MKFPTRLTYALRMMVEISKKHETDLPVPLAEIARITGTSRSYLEQLAMLLKSQSLLQGVSGRKGGYRLARPAEEIRVLDIVKATMGPIQLTHCVSHPESCMRSDYCESRKLWLLINLKIDTVLGEYCLADLTNQARLDSIGRAIERLHTRDGQGVQDSEAEQASHAELGHTGNGIWTRRTGHGPLHNLALDQQSALDIDASRHTDRPAVQASSKEIEKDDYLETLAWLEEELQIRVRDANASIPVNRKNVKVVYTTNLREIKYMPFSLLAAAEIFHAAGEDWTMTTEGWDCNDLFKDFLGKDPGECLDKKVFSSVKKLNAEKIVLSECGHAVWPPKWGTTQTSSVDFRFPVESFIHTMLNYVRAGRIRLDPSRNVEPVTYHDPCILGRYYGITEEPRYLLTKAVAEFREMYPNRMESWCCRGGGGLPTEYNPRRTELSKIKVDQILSTGARVVATSCPNCIDGLAELVGEYNLDLDIKSVSELVSNALILDGNIENK